MLVIALAKGRFLEPSLAVLKKIGVAFDEDVADSRRLIFDSTDKKYRVILVKPVDVPAYVEYGAADAGITGRDVLLESRAQMSCNPSIWDSAGAVWPWPHPNRWRLRIPIGLS